MEIRYGVDEVVLMKAVVKTVTIDENGIVYGLKIDGKTTLLRVAEDGIAGKYEEDGAE